jgi:glycogen synthase
VNNKLTINPSKCALETCDNWGTVSNSYKYDLLKESGLAPVLWKHPHPFSFPNGVRKEERLSIIKAKTPGSHIDSKRILQQKYFNFDDLNNNIPLFSFIGRVTKQKGVHLILDSVESLLYEYNFKIQFLVGGLSDSKEEYGKYCAERMKYLKNRYPNSFWSNPDAFFLDGALANIGSDFAMMPSLFEPGGIVQHEFFCGSTPVIAFKTGGLKDTVFEYNYETNKGNGFNFMSYDVEDFKRCMRRAIQCYKVKPAYEKLRYNAFESVVEEEDVAKAWNTEFYRLQNKMYIDSNSVQK